MLVVRLEIVQAEDGFYKGMLRENLPGVFYASIIF